MTARGKNLSDEDRVLWNLVARSAKPLKGKAVPAGALLPIPAESPAAAPAQGATVSIAAPKPRRQHVAHELDRPTLDRLGKGKLPIEGRVDLHGMSQSEAHELLFSFLRRAHAGGIRYVLVITGKGSSSGGEGVLRRAVPAWLATPSFRPLVSSYDHAALKHGGSGALYVRLRRTS